MNQKTAPGLTTLVSGFSKSGAIEAAKEQWKNPDKSLTFMLYRCDEVEEVKLEGTTKPI